MENFSYHLPFYVVTNGVATQGYTSDLAGGQVGLFDRQTWAVTTASGNGKELFFSQGALGGKGWYGEPVNESHKSPFFMVKDVSNIYKSLHHEIRNEEWIIGYDGSQSSKSLEYIKGQPTSIKLYFHGEPTYRMFNGPKEFVVTYTPPADCVDECATECGGERQDPLPHVMKHIDLFNNHVELRKLGVRVQLVSDTYSAAAATREKYSLTVMDDGSILALAKIQKLVNDTTKKVVRTHRSGITSTYEINQLIADGAPTSFIYDGAGIAQAICGECPAGWTLSAGSTAYFVERPLAGTEDLNDNTARQAFADAVAVQYKTTHTFNGATAVDPTTNGITLTAHGLVTGNKVTYSNGGGTTVVGLTDATDYYVIKVDANTVKLATTYTLALAGTAVDITADGVGAAHTLKTAISAQYLGNDGSSATVKLTAPEGYTASVYNTDSLSSSYTIEAICTAPAGATVAWVLGDTCISGTRTLKIKLNRDECDMAGNRLGDVTAALTGIEGINIGSIAVIAGDACVDEYTVTQNSNDCLDENCLTSNVTFTYNTKLPSIDGKAWEVVDPTITPNADRKVGMRISAGYFDPKFGNCSFDPYDYYETMPLKFELSLLKEGFLSGCEYAALATTNQVKRARISRQTGEWVIREVIMKNKAYLEHVDQWSLDTRMREAFDMALMDTVDRNAYYDLWYISYKTSFNKTTRTGEQHNFTTIFAVKSSEDDAALQTNIINVLASKADITPHINA